MIRPREGDLGLTRALVFGYHTPEMRQPSIPCERGQSVIYLGARALVTKETYGRFLTPHGILWLPLWLIE